MTLIRPLALALALVCYAERASAAEWQLQLVPAAETITRIEIEPGDDPVFERLRLGTANDTWFSLSRADTGELTAAAADAWSGQNASDSAAGANDISIARYSEPTERLAVYGQGNRQSGRKAFGTLSVFDRANVEHVYADDLGQAFTGRAPLLADLDSDGHDEILVTETGAAGGRIAVFRLTPAGLERLAVTPPPLDPATTVDLLGVAELGGDGSLDVITSATESDGGRLQVWTYANRLFIPSWSVPGVQTVLLDGTAGVAAIADFDGDKWPDLLLPGRDARTVRMLTFRDGALAEPIRLPLPAAITTRLQVMPSDETENGPIIIFGLANSTFAVVSQAPTKAAPAMPEVTP